MFTLALATAPYPIMLLSVAVNGKKVRSLEA